MTLVNTAKPESIEHLEFEPEIPCQVQDPLGQGYFRQCRNIAAWWHRLPCCARVGYDCEPHYRQAIDGRDRICDVCGKTFSPRLAEWKKL